MVTWIGLARARLELGITPGTELIFRRIEDLVGESATIHKRAQWSRIGNDARRRTAAREARKVVRLVRNFRKTHGREEWKLSLIINYLRRNDPTLPSVKQMRRYLEAAGVK